MITNTISATGASDEVRIRALHWVSTREPWGSLELDVESGEVVGYEVTTKTSPLDNLILEMGIKYLALNPSLTFSYPEENWEGSISVTDGEVVYRCNKLNGGKPIPLGNMYSLVAEGGFPNCLFPYLA